ncbi:hypothetical protein JCM5350_004883 [Sporobolomyces pararoseus]
MPHRQKLQHRVSNFLRRRSISSESQEPVSSAIEGDESSTSTSSSHSRLPPVSQVITPPASPPLRATLARGFCRQPQSQPQPQTTSMNAVPPISPPTSPPPPSLPKVEEDPREQTLHIALPEPPSVARPSLRHSTSSARPSTSAHSECQRYLFSSDRPLPSSSSTHTTSPRPLSTTSSSFPFADYLAGSRATEPRSAWSDWGTSIAPSTVNLHSEDSAEGTGGASSTSLSRQRTTDPSSVELNEGGGGRDLKPFLKAQALRKFPSTSTLNLKSEGSSGVHRFSAIHLQRRSSLPDLIYNRAHVESLVENFGFSSSLAEFMNTSLGLSSTVGSGTGASIGDTSEGSKVGVAL